MTNSDRYPEKVASASDQENDLPILKPWITPEFTLVGDPKNAHVGQGAKTDFKLKGAHNPPGQS